MNDRDKPSKLAPGWWQLMQNLVAVSGAADSGWKLRPGMVKLNTTAIVQSPCNGLFSWYDDGGAVRLLYAGSSNVYYSADWTAALAKQAPLAAWTWAAADLFQFAFTQGQVYIVNGSTTGYGTNVRFDGTDLHPMGLKAPTVAPTIVEGVAGNLNGNYVWVYTYYDSARDVESDPSPASAITALVNKAATVTMAAQADASADKWRLYRTSGTGDRYYFVAEYAATPATDDDADADLGDEVGDAGTNKDTIGHVCKCIWVLSDGRVCIANDVTDGFKRRIWTSYDNAHPESFPISGRTEAGEENGGEILCGIACGDESLVVCTDSLWLLNVTCTTCTRQIGFAGGVGRQCATVTPYGVFVVTREGLVRFDGASVRPVSGPLDGTWDTVVDSRLPYVWVEYDETTHHLLVTVTTTAQATRNDLVLALDCRTAHWEDPRWAVWPVRWDAMHVNPAIPPASRETYACIGRGIIVTLDKDVQNDAAGATGTKSGTATAGGASTLTDSGATFYTTGSCLIGVDVHIVAGTGNGQSREIQSNTATVLTVYTAWGTQPDATSEYQIGPIPAILRSGQVTLEDVRHGKRWEEVVVEVEQ